MLKSNRTQEKAKREARKKALNPERTPRNSRGTVEGTGDEQVEAVKIDVSDIDFSFDDIDLDTLFDDFEVDLSFDNMDFDFNIEIPSDISFNSEGTEKKTG